MEKGKNRLQIVDTSAPEAERGHIGFYRHTVTISRKKNGELLRRPKKKVRDPGADPGVVGYVDYYVENPTSVYIDLIRVRGDYRRKGTAKKLLDKLYSRPSLKLVLWGRVLNHTAWNLLEYAQEKYPKVRTHGKKFY